MESKYIEKMRNVAPVVLRVGMSLVFFWFGMSQLFNPGMWTAYLPEFVSLLPISATKFVLLNGLFEVVCSVLLFVGAYTRTVSLLLTLHLFGITYTIGWNALGFRDFGLSVATLTIFLLGAGDFSLDNWRDRLERENTSPTNF